MSYGIEVINKAGATLFDASRYVEIAAYTTTVNGNTQLSIPDWCFGTDQTVTAGTYTHAKVTNATYTHNNQIAIKVNDTGGTARSYDVPSTIAGSRVHVVSAQVGSGSSAYKLYTLSSNMTSIRNTAGNVTVVDKRYTPIQPAFYAKPTSTNSNTNKYFFLKTGRRFPTQSGHSFSSILNNFIEIGDQDGSGTSTATNYTVIVALPAYAWGGITGTKAHTAGSDGYGMSVFTQGGFRHHPLQTSGEPFLTYDSRGRVGTPRSQRTMLGGTSLTAVTPNVGTNMSGGMSATLGSASRFFRLNGTQYYKVDTSSYPTYYHWSYMCNYIGNSPAFISWRKRNKAAPVTITDTLKSRQFFCYSEFGEGI